MQDLWLFVRENQAKLLEQVLEHVGLTFLSLLLAVLIALPVGIWITRRTKMASPVLGIAGVLQTIPSIALLGFLLPFLGIGFKPAIVALFLYALLPILRNTYAGINEVDDSVIEAAMGMGMTRRQILWKVELPLAMPVIFAGVRTATVINVGVATLAAYIGAGGLGEFIFGGIALNNSQMILAGAVPAAMLAVLFDQLLGLLQKLPFQKIYRNTAVMAASLVVMTLLFSAPSMLSQKWKAAFDPEFMGRQDGYKGLVEVYGVDFNTSILNAGLMYNAVNEGFVDIISGYSTDGRIKAYNLKPLEDDQFVFPPYHCTPLIQSELLQSHPEVAEALNLLNGQINDSIMTELNYQVDFEKQLPGEVARSFLQSIDLWRPDQKQGGEVLRLGSKIFTEQYILTEMFAQLINGYTDFDTDLRQGLGGTKICFDALRQGEIDCYPEYTGTAFLVLLDPGEERIASMIRDGDAVYDYVAEEFRKQYEIEWLEPLGFNNTYAVMMRAEQMEKYNLKKISDLTNSGR